MTCWCGASGVRCKCIVQLNHCQVIWVIMFSVQWTLNISFTITPRCNFEWIKIHPSFHSFPVPLFLHRVTGNLEHSGHKTHPLTHNFEKPALHVFGLEEETWIQGGIPQRQGVEYASTTHAERLNPQPWICEANMLSTELIIYSFGALKMRSYLHLLTHI